MSSLSLRVVTIVLASLLIASCKPPPQEGGRFIGNLILNLDNDGRRATLQEDFTFVDANELEWKTPQGWIVDGASIPQPLWSVTGGPFSGRFRNASVIHDYYCDVRTRNWEAVHEMFYEAMLAGGVEPNKASLMYLAVYQFGPRWDVELNFQDPDDDVVVPVSVAAYTPPFDQAAFEALQRDVEDMYARAKPVKRADIVARTAQIDARVKVQMQDTLVRRMEAGQLPELKQRVDIRKTAILVPEAGEIVRPEAEAREPLVIRSLSNNE